MARDWIDKKHFLHLLCLGGYVTGQYLLIRIFYLTPKRSKDPSTGEFFDQKRTSKFFPATEQGIDKAIKYIERVAGRTRKAQKERKYKANVYFGVLPRTKEAADNKNYEDEGVVWSKVLWVDVDSEKFPGGKAEALRHLERVTQELGLIPTIRVDSGNGYHLYWILEKATNDLDRIEHINKGLIHRLNSDRACFDRTRILRVPQTRNFKFDADGDVIMKRVVAELYTGLTYKLDDFQAVELPTGQSKQRHQDSDAARHDDWLASIVPFDASEYTDEIGESIWELIQDGAMQGERSETVQKVIVRLVSLDYPEDIIVGVLINPDYGISEKPLEELERGNAEWFRRSIRRARVYLEDVSDSA